MEFFNNDAGETALDTDIFLDDRTNAVDFNLASLYTEDTTKKGTYAIKYRVYHTRYTTNIVTLQDPFTVSIGDPCDLPKSISDQGVTN